MISVVLIFGKVNCDVVWSCPVVIDALTTFVVRRDVSVLFAAVVFTVCDFAATVAGFKSVIFGISLPIFKVLFDVVV